ncbi:type I-E CRISPR-associated protein Cse2/CasB [Streptomyces sp. NPDC059037]|uniref:type I-E CRISPR-associated protein Cse2/CasB n=1 Tax=Streptomyces sp. NPDC059037 TaxID=3346710 RepID=UPI00367A6514
MTTTPAGTNGALAPFERFMATVRRACGTPEGRVILRQALTDNLENPWQLYTVLLPAGGIPIRDDTPEHLRQQAEHPFLLAAVLYAVHDAPNPRRTDNRPLTIPTPKPAQTWENIGWSLARATHTGMRRETATGALSHLCALEYDDLIRELPATISMLRSGGAPVRWAVLARDLTRYQRWPADVRIDWARSYTTPATSKENTK